MINGPALKAIREAQGWTIRGFARAAGVSESFLRDLEAGRRQARPPTVKAIADALRVEQPAILRENAA